ncbi:MAG: sensor histidine kinase KdpD, partial [Deltaproteobacteria bacterium]|nr:sensor histidine kinase KdpD [Deltaproteobacteria bacterium]
MAEDAHRPDPDALLQRVTAEAQRASRARLKVFFGFAPGVGKTYAMLEAARRLRAQGVDVIVGCAETHGRSETAALLQGLEVLPKRRVEHRGTVLEEFDLERALARRPQVLLLDELAHTNAPGLQHAKRHQDVLDLLHAGIDVHTTLNVQHVESLNDVVAQVTGVRVRETVPDALLDRADELELVDLPPDELLQRLAQGKVYLGERAEQAARNFFQRGNLLALRELALRRTAERVDADVRAHRAAHAIDKTWSAAERILVCVGPAPQSAKVLRAGRRMAAGLRAPWSAVVVEPIGVPLGAADRERLDGHLRLAESLGAQVVRLSGARPSEVLLEYARKHDVTRLMLGKPTHARLIDRLRGSFLDQIVRGSGDIDVQVVSGDASEPPRDDPRGPLEMTSPLRGYVWSAVLVTLATALAALLRSLLALPDLVMVYLIVIMATALRFGRGPSLLAAALSVGAYDFFFVPPFFTFAVTDARHTLTFAMMFAVGALLSSLMLRIQRQEQDARAREARTASLYALSRELGGAHDEQAAAQILARHAAEVFGGGVAVLLAKPGGALEERARVGDFPSESSELGVARWVFEFGRPAGLGTETLPGARVICVPLRAGPDVIGILALAPK